MKKLLFILFLSFVSQSSVYAQACEIFVARLSWGTDEDTLRETFEPYGIVSKLQIVMDRATGRSRGFGFVTMPNCQDAQIAINDLDQSELDGRTIVVKMKDQEQNKTNRGGYNRGGKGGGYGGSRGGYGGGGGYRQDGN